MRRFLHLIIISVFCTTAYSQHVFKGTSLSKALIELDQSSKRYDISFVYDELEDFTVTKTVKRGRSVPDAVREVCGFYPVRVSVKGNNILVECIQKDRTKLTGQLVGPDRQPVAYANITLFPLSDTTYIGGGVSNEAGDFVIPCGEKQAKVRISCVGLKTIEQVMPVSDVGIIHMQMENNFLGNVNVSGRMPVIRNKADRLQYIVRNDEFARNLNAQELLSRVPMVTMNGSQAMILGKGPARFMLNGRILDMGDETILQELWTLHSEDIDRIEVISIPSGHDITETGSGYINIVMRRDQALGWRGDVSMESGVRRQESGVSDNWSGRANGSLSYSSEKLDITMNAHGEHRTQTTDNLTTYPTWKDAEIFSDTHARQTIQDLGANLLLRYLPTKHLELGGMLLWQTQWPEKVTDGDLNFPNTAQMTESHAEQSANHNTKVRSLTAYCDWHLDSKGKQLSLTYYNYKKDDGRRSMVGSDYHYNEYYTRQSWENFFSDVSYHIQSARVDLTLPFGFATIDAGASYTNIRNHADVEIQYSSTFSSMNNDGRMLDYQEQSKVAYLSLHHDWDRFAIKAGLRYEHIGWDEDAKVNSTIRYLGLTTTIHDTSSDYWLPSVSLSFKPQVGQQINLSWAASCLRPNFYDLNPFRVYKSAFEYSGGNPLLRPSRISDVELNYHHSKGIYACAYHHHGSNMVMQVANISLLGESKYLSETTPLNIGRTSQTGFYLRYQRQLLEHLMTMAEGDVCYHDAKAQYGTGEIHLYGWGERVAVSADWYLNRRHTLMLNARYQHWFADYRDMTEMDGYGYFNFALRYAMLDDRLKLSIVAKDPFRQHVTNETIWSNTMYQPIHSHTLQHSHYIGLTATYAFGGKKVRDVRRDIENTESKRAENQKNSH